MKNGLIPKYVATSGLLLLNPGRLESVILIFTGKKAFKHAFLKKLQATRGKDPAGATSLDLYQTLGRMVRDQVMADWAAAAARRREAGVKQAYYFSMEFLPGRWLENNLINLGILELCREGLHELGLDLDDVTAAEPDAGLGNGGLGRLAACFLDSLASLGLPGHGVGIRFKYGLFEQIIRDGRQVELPDYWLREGNVWEIRRPEEAVEVRFGGRVTAEHAGGRMVFHHEDCEVVRAVPYDIPVIGYRNRAVNTLRLWHAEAAAVERCASIGCYRRVVDYRHSLESITELLYPDDSHDEGKLMRLKQQYFLVSAGLQSIVRGLLAGGCPPQELHHKIAVHVNDTHPVLAIPELMRILVDEAGLPWEQAWEVTTRTISYTNHTTLSEALERWPVHLFRPLLPRIFEIVQEIDRRFTASLRGDSGRGRNDVVRSRVAIISGGEIRMANLAVVGSHSVNGVAELHTEILKQREMKDFYALFPEKFNNKTNGISHRRWLLQANPHLAGLVGETIGTGWINHPEALSGLDKYAADAAFRERLHRVKRLNKTALARLIGERTGLTVDIDSIFDVQVKRLHPYKRQLLNVLRIMDLYNRLREDPNLDITPRTFIFGAKAFPSFHLAKMIIKLINTVAGLVNGDRRVNEKIKVIFLDNYGVSLAERIIPAADLSEQISTAGKEASGTGNMKFMLNGAPTIGTRDGANIEIAEAVGPGNIFIFGLTAPEIARLRLGGGYCARDRYRREPRLKKVVDQLVNGFLPAPRDEFRIIYDHLLAHNDEFFVLADFAAYIAAQEKAERAYRDRPRWLEICARNIARAGQFSSDRTVSRYASEIWSLSRGRFC